MDDDAKWYKWLVVVALCGGAGSSYMGLTQDTQDRYHAQTAARDFAQRDERIRRIEDSHQLHLQHSARYTQIIGQQQEDIEWLKEQLVVHIRKHLTGEREIPCGSC